jgi:hypothetical protein
VRSKFVLAALLVGAVLTMGASWADKPIDSLATIVGLWSGNGKTAEGYDYYISYVFKEDGSIVYSQVVVFGGHKGQLGPGTVRVKGAKLVFEDYEGLLWTFTLQENKKGRRKLKGLREDGNRQLLKAGDY